MTDTNAIVEAIDHLSKKTTIDYAIALAPIILSIVAILISINTARRQNNIALFEKRLKLLSIMQSLFAFSDSISEADSSGVEFICVLYNSIFQANIIRSDRKSLESFYASVKIMERELLAEEYLFSYNLSKQIKNLLEKLTLFMERVVTAKKFYKEQDAFCSACKSFESDYYEILAKEAKI